MHNFVQILVVSNVGKVQPLEHDEPENVHAEEHWLQNHAQIDERLELGVRWRVLSRR